MVYSYFYIRHLYRDIIRKLRKNIVIWTKTRSRILWAEGTDLTWLIDIKLGTYNFYINWNQIRG